MADADGHTYCGTGIRGVAMAIDTVVWLAAIFGATGVVGVLTDQVETTADGTTSIHLTGEPALAAFGAGIAVGIGYHTLLEWWYGKTLGKYLVSIRVARSDGEPVGLHRSFVRNVLRLIDWVPMFYVVGLVFLTRSDRHRRLGDRFADTAVVR